MERWVGKVAVVTGASAGIGAEIAVRLADLGLIVVGVARRKHLIDKIAEKVTGKGKIYSKKVDLSNIKEIREAFEWVEQKFGGVDILVNNAAYLPVGYITDIGDQPEIDDEDIKLSVDVNVTGLFLASRLAVKSMRKRDVAGHIVNMNRNDAVRKPLTSPYDGPYRVIERKGKVFTIQLHNKTRTHATIPLHLQPVTRN